jgi:hypothetical protein
MPAAVSVYEQKVNSKSTARKVKRQPEISNSEMVTRKKAKVTKDPHHDGSTTCRRLLLIIVGFRISLGV